MADVIKLSTSVQRARAKLQQKAMEAVEDFQNMIAEARADGQYEFALKAQQWLIEHVADDDGTRIVDASVDKIVKVEDKGPQLPRVSIGIALGGINTPALPAAPPTVSITETIIEAEPAKPKT